MDGGGVMTVKTDDMDLAGDIVQSLGTYLGMEDLATTCSFPQEISSLEGLLSRAEELQVCSFQKKYSIFQKNICAGGAGASERGHGGPQRADPQPRGEVRGQPHHGRHVGGQEVRPAVVNHNQLQCCAADGPSSCTTSTATW